MTNPTRMCALCRALFVDEYEEDLCMDCQMDQADPYCGCAECDGFFPALPGHDE